MIVHGREVKFLRTVQAVNEISQVCPGYNIGNLTDALRTDNTIALNEIWVTFVCALSKGYEMNKKWEDKDYVPNPLTKEELNAITETEFSALIGEATQAWFNDKITVEVDEPKKKEEISETSA